MLTNIGDTSWDNRKLYAKTYRNGVLLPCMIRTINGHDFIPLKPYGIDTMGGWGTHNYHWYPGITIYVDYSQGTFHPGDVVQFEVYDRDTNRIISRDTWPHTRGNTEKWMDVLFQSSRRLNTPFLTLKILHSGQRQVSGTWAQGVPAGTPFLGSPLAGS